MNDLATIFEEARRMAPDARSQYLEKACGDDPSLRARVERMLLAAEQADRFFGEDRAETGAPTISAPSEGPGEMIGRYKLLQKIGEGGMGIVYMAEQTEPVVRKVALKIIKVGMDTRQVVARFEAERQALAMMDHPNIAHVLDGGATESGRPYFVMELVQGVPITEFCDKNKLSARERIDLFIPVCQAIQSAHQKGIIHRDIKPSNVLVTLHHGEPMPKVIDFGIAKATSQKLTEKTLFTNFATMIGTPVYMSPEQAEMTSMDIDTRSDVYSLGVLLYELLTGSTPFTEKRLRSAGYGEMQRIIAQEDPDKPSQRLQTLTAEEKTTIFKTRGQDVAELGKALKSDLDWIVMKCLEKDRRRRYDTPNELAADLKRHLANEPVSAAAPTFSYQCYKLYQRHRAAVFTAVSIGAILIVATVVSGMLAIHATRAERARAQEAAKAKEQTSLATAAQAEEAAQRRRAEAGEKDAQELLYAANINLVESYIARNNAALAFELLQETAAYPDRGFEWYYYQRQLHLEIRSFHQGSPILGASVSPGDDRLVTVGGQTAYIWDLQKGPQLLDFSTVGQTRIYNALFFPDRKRLAIVTDDLTVRILEVLTGKALFEWRAGDKPLSGRATRALAISPDGLRVAVAAERHVSVFDVSSAREVFRFVAPGSAFELAFSMDNRLLAAAIPAAVVLRTPLGKGIFRIWSVATGKEELTIDSETMMATVVAFSPDSKRLLGSGSEVATIWDSKTGQRLINLWGHTSGITSASFSTDGTRIVTACDDRTARVWDATTGQELLSFRGHRSGVSWAGFIANGQHVVTASRDGMAKVWEVKPQEAVTIQGRGPYSRLAFSPDGRKLSGNAWEGHGKIWDVSSGNELLSISNAFLKAWSPLGHLIAATTRYGETVRILESQTGREIATINRHGTNISPVAFSPTGNQILTEGVDGKARIWEWSTGKELISMGNEGESINSAAWSSDGKNVALMAAEGKGVSIWEIDLGGYNRPAKATFQKRIEGVRCIAFSPDGTRLAVGTPGSIWDWKRGEKLLVLRGTRPTALAFSPDGKRIALAEVGGVKLFHASTGREMLNLKGPSGTIGSLVFSPDGQRIAAGSMNSRVRIWTAATPEQVADWTESQKALSEGRRNQTSFPR